MYGSLKACRGQPVEMTEIAKGIGRRVNNVRRPYPKNVHRFLLP